MCIRDRSILLLYYADLFDCLLFFYEAKSFLTLAAIFSAIVNVILNAIFIPKFGFVAAAYTTCLLYTSNTNNKTTVNCIFSPEIVTVGNNTYGELNIVSFRNVTRLFIGNFCSIGQNVNFILDAGQMCIRDSSK